MESGGGISWYCHSLIVAKPVVLIIFYTLLPNFHKKFELFQTAETKILVFSLHLPSTCVFMILPLKMFSPQFCTVFSLYPTLDSRSLALCIKAIYRFLLFSHNRPSCGGCTHCLCFVCCIKIGHDSRCGGPYHSVTITSVSVVWGDQVLTVGHYTSHHYLVIPSFTTTAHPP